MKSELTVWENIFANDISDKCLISKIDKELTHINTMKTNNTIKKWGKDLNIATRRNIAPCISPRRTYRGPIDI